jgi:hypothetical protein
MMNMTRAGHGAAVLLASLLTGAAEAARWEQRPDPLPGTNQFNGWAEYAVASDTQIVADAWVNTAGGTIAHFTWWGCFLDWRETNAPPEPPGSFRFAMWMNDAGEALDFPRPAGVSWSAATTNWSATFVGFTQDPRGGDVVTNAVFRFEADLESGQAFDVDGFPGVSNWWLSVFAHYPDSISTNPFGWLVRPAVAASPATSGALRVFSPSNPSGGDGYGAGAPIQHPTGTPWHATFELPGPVAADFGDAPDSNNDLSAPMDAYGPATPALFPTIFRAGQQPTGPRHGSPLSPVRLGTAVSTEAAADSGTDQDGLNNLAPASGQSNQDGGDDGLVLPPTLTAGPGAQVRYVVTAASPWSGYLNLWCDWNRDGDWDDEVVDGVVTAREWAVRNAAVSLGAGVFTNLSPAFAAAHPVATSQLWMRISLAEAPAPVVAGPAGGGSGPADGYSYGETEDHFITTFLQATEDFGDAPAGYPVTLAQDGARHTVGAGLFLGAGVDREADGAPSPAANGDDLAGLDDEDGVTFAGAWAPGQNAAVEIVASAAGFVSAWADFNRNTNWTDSGELWLTGQAVTAGLNHVTVAVPAGLAGGFVAVRVRCATSALFISTPAGAAPDGEVEDYRVLVSGQDFGDAPATFPTALAADGARHEVVPGMQLGALIDAEADGQPGAAATGDDLADLADEDGVLVTGPLAAGTIVTVRVTVASSGYLGAWIDWNRDGDWDLPAERVIVTQALGAGVTDLPVSVPADAAAGTAIARFRFAGVAAEVELPTGAALDGEVEDYALTVSGAGAATAGDYGDAPDAVNQAGTNMTAYAGGGSAGFPTTYSEGASPNGPLHRQPGAGLWLGAAVSIEQAADHDLDADGTNNLVPAADQANLDGGDDGLLAPLALPSLGTASVAFVITSTNAGPVSGFANLWFDWNRDGDWNDELVQGGVTAAEWAVRNQPVSLAGPGNQTVTSLAFVAWHPQPGVVTALWARLSVASEPAPTVTESGPRRGGGGARPTATRPARRRTT